MIETFAADLTVLVIEDNPADFRLIKELLAECSANVFRLLYADRVNAAIPLLEREPVDAILLDLGLPGSNGLETLERIHALSPDAPVVVLSQMEDEALAVKAVRAGAQDFLLKSDITGPLLARALRYAMVRRQLEEQLYRLAHNDSLTGLPNRKLFYDRLSRALACAHRHGRPLALMLLDLDGFKLVNDTYGHQVGDELLKKIGHRLDASLRATDCVARLGGDEFIVYVDEVGNARDCVTVAQKLLEALAEPCHIDGRELRLAASLGIALYPADGEDIETLIRHADAAMYLAKRDPGGQRFHFYSDRVDQATAARTALEAAMRRALEQGEFVVNYQPQVDLHSGRMTGVEALLRWRSAPGTLVLPDQFLPALEESGLIVAVGEWVLDTACQQCASWCADAGIELKVAINVSPRQFRDPALPARVARALHASGLRPELLELELAELSVRSDEPSAWRMLEELNGLGVRLALGNYRGHAVSLRDLQALPVHAIKIDKSIVRDMATNGADAAIVQAVIAVAHLCKMKGVAEGVETIIQAELLREQRCDDAQGYAFGWPLPAEVLTERLRGRAGATRH